MGRYIGGGLKKQQTLEEHGATAIPQPTSFAAVPAGKALVALLDNGLFEAAAWIYDEREFKEFTDPIDPRHRSYWLMDLETARKLAGYEG